ncbi:hypothetical protein CBS101457_003882 [Exobasidium rhododendri]|nr:hypothetical protein CBS101457_003882 [Exobasidium rhododendri]
MSKRLSKRQLREQQELEGLASKVADRKETGSTEPEERETMKENTAEEATASGRNGSAGGVFTQLGEVEEVGEFSGEDTDEKDETDNTQANTPKSKNKRKKKKKKSTEASTKEGGEREGSGDAIAKSAKPTPNKINKGVAATLTKDVSDMSMDEFSALLSSQAQLNSKNLATKDLGATSALRVSGPLSSMRAHLSLSAPFLDPAIELKRQFGAAAIKAYENEANTGTGRGASSSTSARARSLAWNTNFKVKSVLVQPQDTWPPIAKTFTGMTMETIEDGEKCKIGGWVHSRAYRKAQLQFLQAVQSYEPNSLVALLRLYPWHIDTLLQYSEVTRHQGDLGAASDWNARALFAYERTSTTIFSSSLTSHLGPPLLCFDRIENRGFWIACHRHINFMGRRGTWRTALEWVKLMLGLDPTNDHHGMILWLDFLSIKSRQHTWFLECLKKMEGAYSAEMERRGEFIVDAKTPFDEDKILIGEGESSRGSLDWCLGCNYAKALAWRAVEKEQGDQTKLKSTAALRLAMARHPQLLPMLFEKIGLGFPNEMRASSIFSFDSIQGDSIPQLLAHIYVSRSESLWRDSEVSSWLLSTLREIWPTLQKRADDLCRPVADQRSRMGIYRHVLVSDLPDTLRQTLIGLIPRELTSNSAMLNAYDPLSPSGDHVTRYDDHYFDSVTREHAQRQQRQGTSDAGLLNQFMNALRGVRGLEGWGAAMEGMDDDMRQDVMAQILQMTAEARGADQGNDEMPGTFHPQQQQQQQVQGEGQAEGGNEDTTAGPGAFRALRQLLGNMWGQERVENVLQQQHDEQDLD